MWFTNNSKDQKQKYNRNLGQKHFPYNIRSKKKFSTINKMKYVLIVKCSSIFLYSLVKKIIMRWNSISYLKIAEMLHLQIHVFKWIFCYRIINYLIVWFANNSKGQKKDITGIQGKNIFAKNGIISEAKLILPALEKWNMFASLNVI